MKRPTLLLALTVIGLAVWYVLNHYELRGVRHLQLARRDGAAGGGDLPPAARTTGTIRIASFNMQAYGPNKAEKPELLEVLARIIRRFDVVALQEIRSERPEVLQRLLEQINLAGGHYALLAGPLVGRTVSKEQYVFVFNQATLEVDRGASYTVEDPDDLLHRPPLVGWFRVRGPAVDAAFTFTLVNVHIDPEEVAEEIKVLDDVFFSVRDDGRGEDDVILLGDFKTDDRNLHDLGRVSGMIAAISGRPTDTRQTQQYDNLIFQLPATGEYVGRSGVFDFLREYNLTLDQALQISDHLPVWAEFSMLEGGGLSAVAKAATTPNVR
ncbi:MAG: endonuclease/exonuclease/phosphatase family protein [Pirellulaceae bacterium]